jgi:hypothetical protein
VSRQQQHYEEVACGLLPPAVKKEKLHGISIEGRTLKVLLAAASRKVGGGAEWWWMRRDNF